MSKKTKILFAGGKDIGCGCLEQLLQYSKVEVVAVLINQGSDTAPDRWYESAAEIALKNDILVYAPKNINDSATVKLIKALEPELIVAVYYDQILKSEVLEIPFMGCINLHFGLSEEYRGCYPTTWAIINGETKTGITIHYINEGIDAGDIISQQHIDIMPNDTGKSLYYKCTAAGIQLFNNTFPEILKGTAPRRVQVTTTKTKYYKREFPSQQIDFSKSEKEIFDHIRAIYFPPFPLPYFYIGKKKMVIVEETILKKTSKLSYPEYF